MDSRFIYGKKESPSLSIYNTYSLLYHYVGCLVNSGNIDNLIQRYILDDSKVLTVVCLVVVVVVAVIDSAYNL